VPVGDIEIYSSWLGTYELVIVALEYYLSIFMNLIGISEKTLDCQLAMRNGHVQKN
jgi:hypothetical protein